MAVVGVGFLSILFPPSQGPEWFAKIPWMFVFLLNLACVELLELYLNCRQMKSYKKQEAPSELQELVTADEVKKSNAYNADKLQFAMLHSATSLGGTVVAYLFYVYPQLWRLSRHIVGSDNEYLISLIFFGLTMPLSLAESLPFHLYRDFVIEERHGFNKKTLRLFIGDEVKSLLLSVVIGTPVICILIWLVKWAGRAFFIWVWAFLVSLTFFLMTVYPNFIAPLFNKFETLSDVELRGKIESLASSLNFPLTKLYQMDGSKRSAHSNAYMYGMWGNKRIVLYDTLLDLPHNQILAILGHELGHWKLNHTVKNLVWTFSLLFGMLWFFEMLVWSPELYTSFGFDVAEGMHVIVGLFLFSNICSPVSTITGVLGTLMSRTYEFQADSFAVSLGYGKDLQGGLMEIFKQNLGDLDPDPWYAWYHFSHPPLVERLRALRSSDADKKTS